MTVNGFFDSGIRAGGQSSVKDAAGAEFIGPDFETIEQWDKPTTTLRWHLWIEHPGKLYLNSHLVVDSADAGSKLEYSLGGTHLTLATRAESQADHPQGAPLGFDIAQLGWQTLIVRLDSLAGKEVGKLHRLELFGPAATDARVLRARWRPAACHAKFSSSTVAAPKLWVMTTRIAETAKVPSYSPVTTPFGYFLDHQTKRFRLYAAAADWHGNKPMPALNPGAFVEQPGPPDRERSGDLVRDIQRRGWMLEEQQAWHPVDTMSTGKGLAAKHWSITPDGWFSMGMGGMVYREGNGIPVRLKPGQSAVPEWLQGEAIADLHRLPATIGKREIIGITRDSCTIRLPLSQLALALGEKATVTLYHGPEDCLTFSKDLGYKEIKTRFWPAHSGPFEVHEGENQLKLTGLKPGTPHHFRLLYQSPRGQLWTFETDFFRTLP